MKRIFEYGKLAADAVIAKSGFVKDKDALRGRIIERMGLMHGIPQKIGQILSFKDFDSDSAEASENTDPNAAMSSDLIVAILDKELGAAWREDIVSLDESGIAASIGQVHKAELENGDAVAIKVQYLDIAQDLESDLKTLGWLSKPVGNLNSGFDLKSYQEEIGAMLAEELDYEKELARLKLFATWTEEWDELLIPEAIESLSTSNVLCMRWIEGSGHHALSEWSMDQRLKMAEILITFFLRSCFEWKTIHADPHPGNLKFVSAGDDVKLGLVDFGCVKELDEEFVSALAKLIWLYRNGDLDDKSSWQFFKIAGFKMELLEGVRSRLPELLNVILEPFKVNQRAFAPSLWSLGERIEKILDQDRMSFRVAGPPGLIFWIRAFHGLIRYLDYINLPVNWDTLVQKYVPKVSDTLSSKRGSDELIKGDKVRESDYLKIKVLKDGQFKAELTFPAESLDGLEDLIPEDVQPEILKQNIDLDKIIADVQFNNYRKGDVFRIDDGVRDIRVWLE